MTQIKILVLVINSIMLAFLLTDYNFLQGTFISNVFLMALAMCWIKCFDLIVKEADYDR
tara:strand:- start:328 stop:504 length:177 start_codon:yes stop_codon:yes gene_type:complete